MLRFVEPRLDYLRRSLSCRDWLSRRLKGFQLKRWLLVMIRSLHCRTGFKLYLMELLLLNKLEARCLHHLQLLVLQLNLIQELDRQVPLMDEINTKVDKAAADFKNTNVRLKDTVTQFWE
ncbi:uncharacterized protein [Gossypium hirsutum]|uniref:Uncharacterized protein isoform X2 n=1 Tax=Gossypium hirsutum TaxID=3635 RepID=A0ABM2ZTM1_GOSHI|nr:uncharacterized protein LOC107949923 isoform X2 [Gossypium hirsutum]